MRAKMLILERSLTVKSSIDRLDHFERVDSNEKYH